MTQLSEVFIRIQTPFLSTLYSNALQPTTTTVSTVLHYSHYTVSHLFCDNSAPDPTSPRPLWAQERFLKTFS